MVQPPHPAIGYRGDHDACGLPAAAEPGRQSRPSFVTTNQAMGRLDQQGPQFIVAGLDQARISLPLTARRIPGAEPAEACQLLARAKAIKSPNLGSQRRRCYQAIPLMVNSFWTSGSSRV